MAYVGTPRNYGDQRSTLASIIQGEARGVQGQTAVANVMLNRAEANFGGRGTNVLDQALAPRQFQGQVPINQITPDSYRIADQALSGTLPRTLPDSLNYAAPVYTGAGATTAGWATRAINSGDGVNIGGNIFFKNDRGGTPSYNAGAVTGQGTNGLSASSDGTTVAAGGTPMVQPAGGVTNYDAAGNVTSNDNNVASSDLPEIGTEGGSNSAVAGGGSASATGSQAGKPQQGNGGTSTSSSAGAGGVGFYMNEVARAIASALSPATTQAGKDVAKATDGVASATKESGTTVAKGATDAAGITSAQSKANATLAADSAKDYFGRIVIILLGIIFVGGGVAMFVFNKNPIKIARNIIT